MISLKQRTIAIATVATVGLLASAATAQDSAHQSVLEEAHRSYESAVNSQNYESIAGMFSDDAIVLPLTGGVLRGPEEIRQHFEEMQVTSMEVTSNVVKDVGDSIVIDTGTFSLTLPEGAGGGEMSGEYVAVAEVSEDGFVIHSLSTTPQRNAGLTPD